MPPGKGRYFGTNVLIQHGDLYTLYGHLSKILVREGQHVHRNRLVRRRDPRPGQSALAPSRIRPACGGIGENFKGFSHEYLGTLYYNPEMLVSHHVAAG